MTYDEWLAAAMDAPIESLEVCMCGAPIAPDQPICDECGCGELWVEDKQKDQSCAEQSC